VVLDRSLFVLFRFLRIGVWIVWEEVGGWGIQR
jgi:hypothetical protein